LPASFQDSVLRKILEEALIYFPLDPEDEEQRAHQEGDDRHLRSICSMLHELRLTPHVLEELSRCMLSETSRITKTFTSDPYETTANNLPFVAAWLDSHVLPRLNSIFHSHLPSLQPRLASLLLIWLARFRYEAHHALAFARISQFFDLVVEFPDSKPALAELRECAGHCADDIRGEIVEALGRQFEGRLLHAGASTTDVVLQYINMVKALAVVDPKGVVGEAVTEPVRRYLGERQDMVRCVMMGLSEEDDYLASELKILRKVDPGLEKSIEMCSSDEEGVDYDEVARKYDEWEPEPADSRLPFVRRRQRAQDVLSSLVAIKGSCAPFGEEYRAILSERLLTESRGDIQKETKVLEMLKVRFGEDVMLPSSVVLKDVVDSRRVTTSCNFADGSIDMAAFHPLIISKSFWPKIKEIEDSTPGPLLNSMIGVYEKEFSRLKAPRKLVWQRGLGTLELQLQFDNGRALDITTSPYFASLIFEFCDTSSKSVHDLCASLDCDESSVRKRAAFWLQNGILREVRQWRFNICE